MVGRIFKYLHSITMFTAIDNENEMLTKVNISSSSTKLVKPTFNFQIIKMFCGIEKNNAKTRKKNTKTRFMIERSYYLRISDRKSRIDYIRPEIFQASTSNSQMMNLGGMITDDDTIGFTQGFTTLHDRNMAVYNATIHHCQGKIRAHLTYKTDCRIYYDEKLAGKYDLVLQIVDTNFFKVVGPSSFSIETMLIMTIPKHRMNDNYKKMMKRKNVFNEKTMIAYIETVKIEVTSASSTHDDMSKISKHFMPNASTISTPNQRFFAISFDDTMIVIDGTSSSGISNEKNSQDGIILIMNGDHHENVGLFEAKRLLCHKRPRAPLGRHHHVCSIALVLAPSRRGHHGTI